MNCKTCMLIKKLNIAVERGRKLMIFLIKFPQLNSTTSVVSFLPMAMKNLYYIRKTPNVVIF